MPEDISSLSQSDLANEAQEVQMFSLLLTFSGGYLDSRQAFTKYYFRVAYYFGDQSANVFNMNVKSWDDVAWLAKKDDLKLLKVWNFDIKEA